MVRLLNGRASWSFRLFGQRRQTNPTWYRIAFVRRLTENAKTRKTAIKWIGLKRFRRGLIELAGRRGNEGAVGKYREQEQRP